MKKITLSLICLFMYLSLTAQLSDFKIADFVLPELNWSSSSVNFNLQSDGSNNHTKNLLDNNFYNDHFGLGGGINYSWNTFVNNPKWQRDRVFYVSFSPGYFKTQYEGIVDNKDERSLGSGLYLYTLASYRYFYRTLRFFEYGGQFNNNTNYAYHYLNENEMIERDHYFGTNSSFTPEFLFGFGRVEDVSSAWHALEMISDLEKNGLLNEFPDHKQIYQLSELIALRKQSRFFDYRNKIIEDIEQIDDNLSGMGLIAQKGAAYFSSLYDMWQYGIGGRRLSGQSLAAGLTTLIGLNYQLENSYYNAFTYGPGIKLKHNFHRPLNRYWQFDAETSYITVLIFRKALDPDLADESGNWIHRFNTDLTISWYPNTRTHISSHFNAQLGNNRTLTIFQNFLDNAGLHSRLNWENSIYYYISPRVRLSGNLYLTHYYTYDKTDLLTQPEFLNNRLNYGFNIAYTYAIF